MQSRQRRNLTALYHYNFFTSLALTIVASIVFTDQLLLRLDFDLDKFAYVKSAMFIAPALFYQLLAPFLQALDRDKTICLWSYFLRIAVPTALPVIALFTTDKTVLFWSALLIFGFSYTMAAFANNTLMVLYHKVLPGNSFNHYSAIIFLLFNGPVYFSSLAVAYVIDYFAHWSNRDFYWLLGGLQLLMVLFEIPAIFHLRRLRLPQGERQAPPAYAALFSPLRDQVYAKVLALTVLRGVWTGLLVSFITVYFLKVAGFSNFKIVLVTMFTSLGGMAAAALLGKLIDRQGYRIWLLSITALLLTVSGGFALFYGNWCWEWLFIVLVWDGNSSVGGMLLLFLENTAATKLARESAVNLYVGLYSFVRNLATFAGCILGGVWFKYLTQQGEKAWHWNLAETFRWYFGSCGLLLLALLGLLFYAWQDTKAPAGR